MGLSDEDRETLRSVLESASDDVLVLARVGAERLLRDLQDMNSMYPATKEFLVARGLTHVRELDAQGMKDLVRHLESVLKQATN